MRISTGPKKEIRAKLFVNGRSQAVRLAKEFRFEGKEVRVRRVSEGVLLEPVEEAVTKPWKTLEELYARFSREEADPIFPRRERAARDAGTRLELIQIIRHEQIPARPECLYLDHQQDSLP